MIVVGAACAMISIRNHIATDVVIMTHKLAEKSASE
jgi:hypothetical protein